MTQNKKYEVYARVLGSYPKMEISETEYEKLIAGRKFLSFRYEIEERLELLLISYREWEMLISEVSIDSMLDRQKSFFDFHHLKMRLNQKLGTILSFARLYIDQMNICLSKLPEGVITSVDIKPFFSRAYDDSFEYRFMEALRNYSQHENLPVHFVNLTASWTKYKKGREDEDSMEYSLVVLAQKKILQEKGGSFKSKILVEMPEDVNLVYAIRCYIELLSDVHVQIRDLTNDQVNEARDHMEKLRSEYSKLSKKVFLESLYAGLLNGRFYKNEIPLFLQLDDTRIELEKRNKKFVNLRKRHIVTRWDGS